MKKLILSIFSLLICCAIVQAQCPTGNYISFYSQQEVDDFPSDYPNCTEIAVNVGIGGGVANLDGLNQITSISGDLEISYNNGLTNLSGLENLSVVGGELWIQISSALTDLSGLENLDSIGLGLYIMDNDNLHDLSALGNLKAIGEDLSITSSPALINLSGLENINTVQTVLRITHNDNLVDLSGLENINTVGGALSIRNNPALINLSALENLNTIGGDLRITYNGNLTDLMGMKNIAPETIADLNIYQNPKLSLCALPNICTYLANGGTSDIHDNAPDCNAAAEILAICSTSFPVELLDFQAQIQGNTTLLTWKTATETNNAGFEVQRSRDGIEWQKIAWQDGQGTTSALHNYVHRDLNPLFGTSYYRLRQVDFDDTFTYSDIVSIRYTRTPVPVSIYPNPVKDKLYVQTDGQSIESIFIFDARGKQITTSLTDDSIDVSGFAKGIYTLKVTVNGEDFCEKIIVK